MATSRYLSINNSVDHDFWTFMLIMVPFFFGFVCVWKKGGGGVTFNFRYLIWFSSGQTKKQTKKKKKIAPHSFFEMDNFWYLSCLNITLI